MNEAKTTLLRMVRGHDGKWGWYQIDRALSIKGIVGIHIPDLMTTLISDGLVTCSGDVQLAATKYSLTAKGREMIDFLEIKS